MTKANKAKNTKYGANPQKKFKATNNKIYNRAKASNSSNFIPMDKFSTFVKQCIKSVNGKFTLSDNAMSTLRDVHELKLKQDMRSAQNIARANGRKGPNCRDIIVVRKIQKEQDWKKFVKNNEPACKYQ